MLTHGYATELARWLQEKGYNAEAIQTVSDVTPVVNGGDA
jgi:hypothetical protein